MKQEITNKKKKTYERHINAIANERYRTGEKERESVRKRNRTTDHIICYAL